MEKFYCIVPAAGIGARMGASKPKSYLSLDGETIFSITLNRLLCVDRFEKIVVALAKNDTLWQNEPVMSDPRIVVAQGGAERHLSVMGGLKALEQIGQIEQVEEAPASNDWVLVHDIARPCVPISDIDRLMDTVSSDPVGGILATPIKDTLKQVNEQGVIDRTIPRDKLWAALTPQMFRLGALKKALSHIIGEGVHVTDEASAIEYMGWSARVVQGSADNIKVTLPEDLRRAAQILSHQPSSNT